VTDVEQGVAPPVFEPDEAMQEILARQHETPLTIDMFEGRENEVFTIVDGETEAPMTLVKVERLEKYEGAPCQNPGSLLFRIEKSWSIPQRLFLVRSDGHDDIVIFLTNVVGSARDTDHLFLETIFN